MRKEVLDLKCIINGIPIGNMTYDELRRYAYDQIVRKRNFDELVIEGGRNRQAENIIHIHKGGCYMSLSDFFNSDTYKMLSNV